MKSYLEFQFDKEENVDQEVLMAWLGQLPFDSIWEDDQLKAYMSEDAWNQQIKANLEEMISSLISGYQVSKVQNVNWNERWESDFQPVEIADFCRVRASFHAFQPGFEHDIVINPKMSFGTGHHETTFMMIETMQQLDFKGRDVLDFGSGTGILAILAGQLGAQKVIGVEIESMAVENSNENKLINQQPDIFFIEGQLQDIPNQQFDIILANINRKVLLESLPQLKEVLHRQGHLMLSGILREDEKIMREAIDRNGFQIIKVKFRGDWSCFLLN